VPLEAEKKERRYRGEKAKSKRKDVDLTTRLIEVKVNIVEYSGERERSR